MTTLSFLKSQTTTRYLIFQLYQQYVMGWKNTFPVILKNPNMCL